MSILGEFGSEMVEIQCLSAQTDALSAKVIKLDSFTASYVWHTPPLLFLGGGGGILR